VKVRCLLDGPIILTCAETDSLGLTSTKSIAAVSAGNTYLVHAITIPAGDVSNMLFLIENDLTPFGNSNYKCWVPLTFFEIIDPSIEKTWMMSIDGESRSSDVYFFSSHSRNLTDFLNEINSQRITG
jgi:hypothetical protein